MNAWQPGRANRGQRRGNRVRAVQRMRLLALTTLVATYLLIVLGSTVRVTGSGMGCKGWPLCSGSIGPIDQFHPLMEQSHRYLVTIVTVLVVGLAILASRTGAQARLVRGPALAGVGVVAVQVALGAVTVVTNNAPVTVALHLAVGLLFLGVVTVTAVASFADPERSLPVLRGTSRLAWAAVVGLFLVLVSGSLVVDGGAEAACPSWPVCLGSRAAGGLVNLQLTHRSVVLVGGALVAFYLLDVRRGSPSRSPRRRLAMAGLGALALQVGVGAVDALLRAPEALADLHLAVAAALWATVVATVAIRDREPSMSRRGRRGLRPLSRREPSAARRPVVTSSATRIPPAGRSIATWRSFHGGRPMRRHAETEAHVSPASP